MKIELEVEWVDGGNLDERLYESVVAALATRLLKARAPEFEGDDDDCKMTRPGRSDFETRVMTETSAIVRTRATEVADRLVAAEVERLIREGWNTTDTYGRPKERVTVADVVRAQLAKEAPRGYNDPKELAIEKLAKTVLEEVLRTEFKKELDDAKASFRAQVDGVIQSKLAETLRDALGLKR